MNWSLYGSKRRGRVYLAQIYQTNITPRRTFHVNQKNLSVIDEVCTADCVLYDPSGPIQGREALKQFIGSYLGAFPEFHVTIEDIIAEGDKVVVRQTTTATHQGELMGIPPTGKRVKISGMHITRVADGKMVEEWANDDVLGLLQQLGVIPSMG